MENWNDVNERMNKNVKTLCVCIWIGLGILFLTISIAQFFYSK
jgi:hypothetical protein